MQQVQTYILLFVFKGCYFCFPSINFFPDTTPLRDIYKISKILKLPDYITLQNALLIKDFFNKENLLRY